jgi:hypothetical protein
MELFPRYKCGFLTSSTKTHHKYPKVLMQMSTFLLPNVFSEKINII